MSKYCVQLKATEYDHLVQAQSDLHDWTVYISDNDDIVIVKKEIHPEFGNGYLIRSKGSQGEPIFVKEENIGWFCGGCCEWYDHDPNSDECDDCELNFDGSIKG